MEDTRAMFDKASIPEWEEVLNLEKTQKFFRTSTGARLSYYEYGSRGGEPVVFFHGTGSHVHGMLLDKPASDKGFRIIAIDRPGIGLSDFRPGWTVLNFAKDVGELADAMGIEKFGCIGISGAGPTLMAAAFLLPHRLKFVIDLACAMPLYSDPESLRQLGSMDRFYARMGTRLPLWVFRMPFWLIGFTQKVLRSPKAFARMFSSSLSPSDREIFAEKNAQFLFNYDFRQFFRQGTKGAAYDAMTVYRPWGFRLSDIRIPIDIYHGKDDRFVPISFSRHLQAEVSGCSFTETEGQGHFYWLANSSILLENIRSKYFKYT